MSSFYSFIKKIAIFLVVGHLIGAPIHAASKRPPQLRKLASSNECFLQSADSSDAPPRALDCSMTAELTQQYQMAVQPIIDSYSQHGEVDKETLRSAESVLSCLSQCRPCSEMGFTIAKTLDYGWALQTSAEVTSQCTINLPDLKKKHHKVVSGYGSEDTRSAASVNPIRGRLSYSPSGNWKCHLTSGESKKVSREGSKRRLYFYSRGVFVQDDTVSPSKKSATAMRARWVHFTRYTEAAPIELKAIDKNTLRFIWPKQAGLEPFLEINHEGYPVSSNFVDSNTWLTSQCQTDYRRGKYYPRLSVLDDSITEICEDGDLPPCNSR